MDDLRVTDRLVIPAEELSWSASRASGPGGQNVNKVSSKVDLRFDLPRNSRLSPEAKLRLAQSSRLDADGCVIVISQVTRDQSRNLEDAREKLALLIRAALVVPKKRRPTKKTRGSQERRLGEKKKHGALKRDRSRSED
jgi:ribosome-associated protein